MKERPRERQRREDHDLTHDAGREYEHRNANRIAGERPHTLLLLRFWWCCRAHAPPGQHGAPASCNAVPAGRRRSVPVFIGNSGAPLHRRKRPPRRTGALPPRRGGAPGRNRWRRAARPLAGEPWPGCPRLWRRRSSAGASQARYNRADSEAWGVRAWVGLASFLAALPRGRLSRSCFPAALRNRPPLGRSNAKRASRRRRPSRRRPSAGRRKRPFRRRTARTTRSDSCGACWRAARSSSNTR
jgi:hypothetical protein